MTEMEFLIEDLKAMHEGEPWHGPSLKELLADLTPAQAVAKPIPNAHSIWELVLHLRGWQDVSIKRLDGIALSEPTEGDFPAATTPTETEWRQTCAALDAMQQRLIDKIAALTPEQLDQPVAGKDYNARFLLRGAIHHHIYHGGQIAMLRKFV